MAKEAAQIGPKHAADKYTRILKQRISKQTVFTWLEKYKSSLQKSGHVPETLKDAPRGRPKLLGDDLDQQLQTYLRQLRVSGGIVNRPIVIGAAKGLVMKRNRAFLVDFGGEISLTKSWADSLLKRMNFVRRKGTKAARTLPADFPEIRKAFLQRVKDLVGENDIPPELVINWDQTGLKIIPASEWTLEQSGAPQVSIVGAEDKRQITAVLAVSLGGELLPPQLLYAGKTPQCHPNFRFPTEWDIHHSESHWSNEKTMLQFVSKVVVPWFVQKRAQLKLPADQKCLALFDVFAAHRQESLYKLLKYNNIEFAFIPASCTSMLQPLDADGGINAYLKRELRDCFTVWYGEQFAEALQAGIDVANVKVNLGLAKLKAIHANWFLKAFDNVKAKPSVIRCGWMQTGIAEAVAHEYEEEF